MKTLKNRKRCGFKHLDLSIYFYYYIFSFYVDILVLPGASPGYKGLLVFIPEILDKYKLH
jgi:hypothetical protein